MTWPRENAIFVGGCAGVVIVVNYTPPPVAQSATPPAKGGGHSGVSLRRSTINVENVGVRLWQSRYNMSAGVRPQCFFIARDDKGGVRGLSRTL